MAIILRGKSECPLCGKVLQDGEDVMGTPHFLIAGPLSSFSDVGMHRSCFIAWPRAEEFRLAFNEAGRSWPGGPRQMLDDGMIVRGAAAIPKASEPRANIAVLGIVEERTELLDALASVGHKHRRPMTTQPPEAIREYIAIIRGEGEVHHHVTVGATSGSEARSILVEAYGPAKVLSLFNEEDAQRPRR